MLSIEDKDLSNKDKTMSDVAYAQDLFSEAFPKRRFGSVKAMLFAAQRFIDHRTNKEFTVRRARSIWEGTAKRIDGEELDALRAALIEESKREQEELRARLASLDEKLAVFDEAGAFATMASEVGKTGGYGRVDHARNGR